MSKLTNKLAFGFQKLGAIRVISALSEISLSEHPLARFSRAQRSSRAMLFSALALSLVLFSSCAHTESSSSGAENNSTSKKWNTLSMKGADISYLNQLETLGAKFYSEKGGEEKPLLDILKNGGTNYIRLRLWHNPESGWCSTEKTLEMAKRVKKAGLNLLLDFHYSDSWADPEKQTVPSAWKNYSVQEISDAVYSYTKETLGKFNEAGAAPDMVQVGNEINAGIIWPTGKIWEEGRADDFTNTFKYLSSGIKAVRETCPKAKVMLHLAKGGYKSQCVWWLGEAQKSSIDYDVIGLSFYSIWDEAKTFENLSDCIETYKRSFSKEVVIAETYYPWTLGYKDGTNNTYGAESQLISGFAATEQGQKNYFRELCKIVIKSGGSGVFWWEPDSVSHEGFGTDLENVTWFNFDNVYNGTGDVYSE